MNLLARSSTKVDTFFFFPPLLILNIYIYIYYIYLDLFICSTLILEEVSVSPPGTCKRLRSVSKASVFSSDPSAGPVVAPVPQGPARSRGRCLRRGQRLAAQGRPCQHGARGQWRSKWKSRKCHRASLQVGSVGETGSLESEFLIDPCKFLERCLFHGELVALRGERGEDGLV